ncbi:MAG TPA: hypothetical protein VN450_02340 [Candidatus Methylomirabilis sp.]|nr:hypothetical protein [Candidatus Methylomirabilis sp.]
MRPALLCLLAALLPATACTTAPFRPTEPTRTRPTTAAALVANLWTAGNGTFLIRQSGLLEFQGARMPMVGILKLDTGNKTARLVGMDDMGVKLFDLSVDRRSSRTHFTLPALDRYPGLAGAVSDSVRRIFLEPEPAEGDALAIDPHQYRLSRDRDGTSIRFLLGGQDAQLQKKSCSGPNERWEVRYHEYRRRLDLPVPDGIVLDDYRAGYRLTLWTESVARADE